jgi:hypothetical protein
VTVTLLHTSTVFLGFKTMGLCTYVELNEQIGRYLYENECRFTNKMSHSHTVIDTNYNPKKNTRNRCGVFFLVCDVMTIICVRIWIQLVKIYLKVKCLCANVILLPIIIRNRKHFWGVNHIILSSTGTRNCKAIQWVNKPINYFSAM